MQHMMAEERIIGRRCEIWLPQHHLEPVRLSTSRDSVTWRLAIIVDKPMREVNYLVC